MRGGQSSHNDLPYKETKGYRNKGADGGERVLNDKIMRVTPLLSPRISLARVWQETSVCDKCGGESGCRETNAV